MNVEKLQERYEDDPQFHRLVDLMYAVMADGNLTITEMRDSVFLAAIRFERIHVRDRYVVPDMTALDLSVKPRSSRWGL